MDLASTVSNADRMAGGGGIDVNVTTRSQWLKRLPPWLYKLGAQAWLDYDYPRHLFIETNASCNLRCGYCPRERRADEMDFSLYRDIIDEASTYGSRSLSHHLFGEPLLYSHWKEAIHYAKGKRPQHTVLLTTNGTRLNQEVDRLIEANPDLVLWSWRPEAKFTPETKEKLRQWGKFRVRFIEEVTPKEAYAEWAEWPNVEGRHLHNYGGHIDVTQFQSNSPLKTSPVQNRWPCYHLWLAPAVAWNGNILMCCALPHHEEVLGHFPEMSVHEAWTGQTLKAIRESHLKGQYGGACTNCDVWKQTPDLFFQWQKG